MNLEICKIEFDKIDGLFENSFGKLSQRELNLKPDTNTWSISENINHLIITGKSYYPIFDLLQQNKIELPFLAKFGFFTNFMGNMILKSVQPENRRKMKTFPIWDPMQSDLKSINVNSLVDFHKEFINKLSNIQKHINSDTIIYSPANTKIVYKFDTCIEIIIAHEYRHYRQALKLHLSYENTKKYVF